MTMPHVSLLTFMSLQLQFTVSLHVQCHVQCHDIVHDIVTDVLQLIRRMTVVPRKQCHVPDVGYIPFATVTVALARSRAMVSRRHKLMR